ncbi:MAG: glutamine-hydrolyzing GMP synthase [Christensenellales bacterium]
MSKVIVLDFGGQYSQLIVRRVREAGIYCEIYPCSTPVEKWAQGVQGIILTGGPKSVYAETAKQCSPDVLTLGVPVLGICYGTQWITHQLGGQVGSMEKPEYGPVDIKLKKHPLFEDVPDETVVWMNHPDGVMAQPQGFDILAHTAHCPAAAIADDSRRIYGMQFHPEVVHTPCGVQMLQNFLYRICGCEQDWRIDTMIDEWTQNIKEQAGGGKVLCALSGGVDSTVAAVLVHRAIGDRLTCVFVDHGLLRKDEATQVLKTYEQLGLHVVHVNAAERFLNKLKGITSPEEKRKIIGREFIAVFEEEAAKLGEMDFLVQGTIYPDVIESGGDGAATIKSHHNVGGLPDNMAFTGLIEPLRLLFKDEVRALGEALMIPEELVWRQPFPGPGLAIRVLGEITPERLDIVRESDAIFREEIANAGLQKQVWQYFTVFTPLRTVGVMGDERTYDYVVALRAVISTDAMTVEAAELPYAVLKLVMNRIINEVKGVNRVVYDLTSKPPGTIEWE